MQLEMDSPPPPVQPILPTKTRLTVRWFCPMGPKYHTPAQIAVFEDLHETPSHRTSANFAVMSYDRVAYNMNELYIPIPPLTLVALKITTLEELGYPETADAYLKLIGLM